MQYEDNENEKMFIWTWIISYKLKNEYKKRYQTVLPKNELPSPGLSTIIWNRKEEIGFFLFP